MRKLETYSTDTKGTGEKNIHEVKWPNNKDKKLRRLPSEGDFHTTTAPTGIGSDQNENVSGLKELEKEAVPKRPHNSLLLEEIRNKKGSPSTHLKPTTLLPGEKKEKSDRIKQVYTANTVSKVGSDDKDYRPKGNINKRCNSVDSGLHLSKTCRIYKGNDKLCVSSKEYSTPQSSSEEQGTGTESLSSNGDVRDGRGVIESSSEFGAPVNENIKYFKSAEHSASDKEEVQKRERQNMKSLKPAEICRDSNEFKTCQNSPVGANGSIPSTSGNPATCSEMEDGVSGKTGVIPERGEGTASEIVENTTKNNEVENPNQGVAGTPAKIVEELPKKSSVETPAKIVNVIPKKSGEELPKKSGEETPAKKKKETGDIPPIELKPSTNTPAPSEGSTKGNKGKIIFFLAVAGVIIVLVGGVILLFNKF